MNNSFTFSFKSFFYLLILSTVIFLILSFLIVVNFFYQKSYEFNLEDIHKHSKINNVIIGDSQFVYGLKIEGYENISYPSLSLRDTISHLKQYYNNRKPEKIIFQFSPAFLSSSRFESDPILIPSSSIYTKIKIFYFQDFKYLSKYWKLIIKEKLFGKKIESDIVSVKFNRWIDLPLEERKKIANKRVLVHLPEYKKYDLLMSDLIKLIDNFKYINKNLSFCLVVPPFSKEYLEAFNKVSDLDKFSEYLNLISLENNIKYYNLYESFSNKQHLFADQEHLNNYGRNIFSDMIKKSC
jgi:hypothetical protein